MSTQSRLPLLPLLLFRAYRIPGGGNPFLNVPLPSSRLGTLFLRETAEKGGNIWGPPPPPLHISLWQHLGKESGGGEATGKNGGEK